MDTVSTLKNTLMRERKARKNAEKILEQKTYNLFLAKEQSEKQYESLKKSKEKIEQLHNQLAKNQSQLVQSEKMALLGQLAAGFAHEINNPIGFILSNLKSLYNYVEPLEDLIMLLKSLNNETISPNDLIDKVTEVNKTIETEFKYFLTDLIEIITDSFEGAERVKDIVQNLKQFVRLDDNELKCANINEEIESTLKVINNQLKYKCSIKKYFDETLPKILCHPGQLNQVFMNLLVNASQAIKEKGDILIKTYYDQQTIFIEITDTGEGIDEANLNKLFNPFFTTKPKGQGTGLGLSISLDIIHGHQGEIIVRSIKNQGTTFTVTLPIKKETQCTTTYKETDNGSQRSHH